MWDTMSVLHVGSGSSLLPESMSLAYPTIAQVVTDISPIVIQQMQDRQQQKNGVALNFAVMDATCMVGVLDDTYDLIIDKGTFDAMRTDKQGARNALKMLDECLRVLKQDTGILLLISSQIREAELVGRGFHVHSIEEIVFELTKSYCKVPAQTYFAHHCTSTRALQNKTL